MEEPLKGPWRLYDYLDDNGKNIILLWGCGLEKIQRIKLEQKLDLLRLSGPDLAPGLLAGHVFEHIYKLRIHGGVQLRPLLCKCPIDNDKEFTLLLGAIEVGGKLPAGAEKKAARNRESILRDHKRRCVHERIR